MVEVETAQPSPFARSLLFGYVARVPVRGRRAAGRAAGRGAVARPDAAGRAARPGGAARAARPGRRRAGPRRSCSGSRRPPGPRRRGRRRPAPRCSAALDGRRGRRCVEPPTRRGMAGRRWRTPAGRSGSGSPARSAGPPSRTPAGCATRSACRCRSACRGVPRAGARPAGRPGRPVRPHPRPVPRRRRCARRLGLGVAVVTDALPAAGRVRPGRARASCRPAASGTEWCDAEVLRLLRRRSLAALRQEVEPVDTGRAGPVPAGVAAASAAALRGVDGRAPRGRAAQGCAGAGQRAGAAGPAGPGRRLHPGLARRADAPPARWSGRAGALPGNDGWVSLHVADAAPLTLPDPGRRVRPGRRCTTRCSTRSRRRRALLPAARRRGRASTDDAALVAALWDLVWAGLVDQRHPRAAAGSASAAAGDAPAAADAAAAVAGTPAAGRALPARGRAADRGRPLVPAAGPRPRPDPARPRRSPRRCSTGTAWSPAARWSPSALPGGFAAVYRVLAAFEEAGRAGAATSSRAWAPPSSRCPARSTGCGRFDRRPRRAASRVRGAGAGRHRPGQPVRRGAALAGRVTGRRAAIGPAARPARWSCSSTASSCSTSSAAGARCCPGPTTPTACAAAADALALAVRDGALGTLRVERADGEMVTATALGDALAAAGFRVTPRGLRLRS